MARRRIRSYVITSRQIYPLAVVIILSALIIAGFWVIREGKRFFNSTKPGITLAGVDMGGLLPDEVRDRVQELAKKVTVGAQDAFIDPRTGRVTPEVVGRVVDIDATVERVLSAGPKEAVDFVTTPVIPRIKQDFFKPHYSGKQDRRRMALMFNVAWGQEFIPGILEVLRQNGIRATFFFTGTWVEDFPDLTRKIAQEGQEIANHGYSHDYANQLDRAGIEALIMDNQKLLEKLPVSPSRLFAPPAGEFNELVVKTAAELGFRTILWTLDTVDWQRPAPEAIIERIVPRAKNGALVLMHPTEPTLKALPELIKRLKEKGFELVTVSQILED